MSATAKMMDAQSDALGIEQGEQPLGGELGNPDLTHDQLLEAEEIASQRTMGGLVLVLLIFLGVGAVLTINWLGVKGIL